MNNSFDKESLEKYLFEENIPEEEITNRQWQIIEAATKIFSEKGFDGSRTSDIAKEADIAEGTIFRYYKTKKDILVGLLLPLITKFFRPLILMPVEKIMENNNERPVDELLADILYDRVQLAKKNMPLVKTMLIEAAYHPEILEPLREEIIPNIIPYIDKFIEDNIKNGELRNLKPRLVTRTVMSMLIGYMVLTSALPDIFKDGDDKEEIEKLADILLNGLKNRDGINL